VVAGCTARRLRRAARVVVACCTWPESGGSMAHFRVPRALYASSRRQWFFSCGSSYSKGHAPIVPVSSSQKASHVVAVTATGPLRGFTAGGPWRPRMAVTLRSLPPTRRIPLTVRAAAIGRAVGTACAEHGMDPGCFGEPRPSYPPAPRISAHGPCRSPPSHQQASGPPGAALSAGLTDRARRQLAWWLGGCAGWVFSMVVLGGVTRLTRSGLSMTDWKFTGG
jgi:hypothetical protein